MTLHLKSRGYPFRPRLLFSSFIVVGVGSPNCVLFQERTNHLSDRGSSLCFRIFVPQGDQFLQLGDDNHLL